MLACSPRVPGVCDRRSLARQAGTTVCGIGCSLLLPLVPFRPSLLLRLRSQPDPLHQLGRCYRPEKRPLHRRPRCSSAHHHRHHLKIKPLLRSQLHLYIHQRSPRSRRSPSNSLSGSGRRPMIPKSKRGRFSPDHTDWMQVPTRY
jgi:hypothetical protein